MFQRLKKKCLRYKGNEECEGEFWVDVRAYKLKKYCDKCQKKKNLAYIREYSAKARKAERAKNK